MYKTGLPFFVPVWYTGVRKEVGRMLDIIDLFVGTDWEESASDNRKEAGFACFYFACYPYLNVNA